MGFIQPMGFVSGHGGGARGMQCLNNDPGCTASLWVSFQDTVVALEACSV